MHYKAWYKVPLSRLIVLVGLFSFFRPTIFEKFSITNSLFNGLLILSFLLCTLDYFRRGNAFCGSFIKYSIVFYGIMAVSTLANHGSVSRMLMYVMVGFCSVVFAIYLIKYEFVFATKFMRILTWIYVTVNIATIILFPNGVVQMGSAQAAVFFLGQPTRYMYFYLPGLLFCYLGDEYEVGHVRKNTVVLYFICLATLLAAWSVGSMLAMMLLIPFFLLKKMKVLNGFVYYITQLTGFFGLTFFSIQNLFAEFVTLVLKKDLTMSSRTRIWDRAILELEQTPLLGCGVLDNTIMQGSFGFVHVHNHLLQVALQCGYIGLAVFLWLLLVAYNHLQRYRNFMPAKVIAFFLFMIGIQLLVDTVDGVRNHYIFLMAMGAYIDEIYKVFQSRKN